MSDSIPDVTMQANVWIDVYALTGIPQGTSLVLNNKASSSAFVQVRPTAPSASSNDGWPLRVPPAGDPWVIVDKVPASSKVWVKGGAAGKLFVQVYD